MERFILNVIHRPEMVPEYAEKVTGHGKGEDISRKELIGESLDIFKTQQEIAHKNGIRTTIQMTYASLFNDEAVALAKEHHRKFGDEIALSLLGLPCKEFREKYRTKDFCIWMFSKEDKEAIVTDVFEKFHQFLSPVHGKLLLRCRFDEFYQEPVLGGKMCGSYLLGGGAESLSYLQQFLVYAV